MESDEELANRTRAGDERAFAELWRRHSRPGRTAARQFRSIADADDILSEAYLRILQAMRRGGGPHEAFRPYLYRTIRNVALRWQESAALTTLDAVDEMEDERPGPEEATLEGTTTTGAFRSLPERWQTILWYTEVEGIEPAEAAPFLGMTPNSAAALAYRAREGFKKAWLQAHVNANHVPLECRWTTERMGEYARGGLSLRARQRFDEHLKTCMRCSIVLEEVDGLSGRLAAILLPAVLGGAAGAGLLAQLSKSGGSAASASAQVGHPVGAGRALFAGGSQQLVVVGAAAVLGITVFTTAALTASGALFPSAPGSHSVASHSGGEPSHVASPRAHQDRPLRQPVVDPVPPPAAAPIQFSPPSPVIAPPPVVAPDTIAPEVPTLISPVAGLLTNDPFPTFTGTGEPGAFVQVERLSPDGATALETVATGSVDADGSWSAPDSVRLPDGAVPIRITQIDAAGNRSQTVTSSLTVDTVALAPSLDPLPAGQLLYLPQIVGSAEPSAVVTLRDGTGTPIGTVTADSAGAWSLALPDPERDGTSISATQTDPAGNVSTPSAPIGPLDFDRPSFASPADGAVVPSTDGATIVQVELAGIPGMQVEVLVDGTGTGNIHTLEDTPIARVTVPLTDGAHTVGVRYYDPVGELIGSMTTLSFTIEPQGDAVGSPAGIMAGRSVVIPGA